MEDFRKRAYRLMLHEAMADAKWLRLMTLELWNPLGWRRVIDAVRRTGVVADAFYFLSYFSARDFEGFDEERFWREFAHCLKQNPSFELARYKQVFDREVYLARGY